MGKIAIWSAAALSALALSAAAAAVVRGPVYPPFGLDLTAQDKAVRPGDDFFQYANGAYLARTAIPADRSAASRRFEMTDRMEAQLHDVDGECRAHFTAQRADEKAKVGRFYAAFMDEAQAERLGATPLKPELDAIRAASDRAALARLMGEGAGGLYPGLFGVGIDADLKQPGRYAVYLSQSGLGLPDRDYYLRPDLKTQRDAYRAYAAHLLALIGWPDPERGGGSGVSPSRRGSPRRAGPRSSSATSPPNIIRWRRPIFPPLRRASIGVRSSPPPASPASRP